MKSLLAGRARVPMIFQSEINECGLACLAMVSGYHGRQLDVRELRSSYSLSAVGASLRHLMAAAQRIQLSCRALKLELADIDKLSLPAILHWDMDHFVLLKQVRRTTVVVHDPAVGIRRYSREELGIHFTGIALEVFPDHGFQPRAASSTLGLRELLQVGGDFRKAVLQVFLLSLIIQLLALLSPLYLQLVIDQGLSKGDMELVFMIALLFVVLTLARHLVSYCRGLALLRFANRLGLQLVSNSFRHLLRLPLAFFEKRELGDIVSRFGSLETIKQLVTQEMITVVVDGLFSLITLVLLFLYSLHLALLALAFMAAFALLRTLTVPLERDRRQESLVAGARQQSRFIENIKSIAVTKVNGIEQEREADWQNCYVDYVNAGYQLAHFQLGLSSVQGLLLGLDHIATIYFGSTLVHTGALSLGQLMSFIFLKQHFTSSINAMLPKLAEIRLLSLELDRVADIVLQTSDGESAAPALLTNPIRGKLEACKLSFRYSESDPLLIDRLSFTIQPAELVAITGRSGSGKSTLLKLLLALEKPGSGTLRIDDQDTNRLGFARIREHTAAVLHGDSLLAGDIAYNINLGLEPFNEGRLRKACERAGILDLIAALPLGFSTRIGELGCSFSAGQVQRLLLARAFYRLPRILVLDEALSHLGNQAAIELLNTIRRLDVTVILVTHNPELIARADQRISVDAQGG